MRRTETRKGTAVATMTAKRKRKDKADEVRKVVLVDDERFALKYWIKALKFNDFEVEVVRTADKARQYFKQPKGTVVAVILDIMMPPGRFGAKKTNEGMHTGIYLMYHIVEVYVAASGKCPPIAVLTNLPSDTVAGLLEEVIEPQDPSLRVRIWPKLDVSPHTFADQFRRWIDVKPLPET
jgi:CheY-like chemotaxis protein